jgi:hypothetical protein
MDVHFSDADRRMMAPAGILLESEPFEHRSPTVNIEYSHYSEMYERADKYDREMTKLQEKQKALRRLLYLLAVLCGIFMILIVRAWK